MLNFSPDDITEFERFWEHENLIDCGGSNYLLGPPDKSESVIHNTLCDNMPPSGWGCTRRLSSCLKRHTLSVELYLHPPLQLEVLLGISCSFSVQTP